MDKKEIYRSIIASNSTHPEHKNGKLENIQGILVKSQTCNDHFEIFLEIKDGLVQKTSFAGNGCAISTASINLLLGYIHNQTLQQARELVISYLDLIFKNIGNESQLKDLMAFEFVNQFANRVECATIGPKAILEVLHG